MAGPQTYGSEPVSQPPPPAPMPAPVAAPPPRRMDVSKPSLVVAVIALALALIAMVAFPGPTGPEGPEGVQGPEGPEGDEGDDGADGADGTDGTDGIACWDLNGNGTGDIPDEDINGDSVVDVLDCTGPPGPGSVMNYSYFDAGVVLFGCTNSDSVTIDVPAAGSIVVSSLVKLVFNHQNGVMSGWGIFVEDNAATCNWNEAWIELKDSADSTDVNYETSGFTQKVFQVAGPGTYTYYVNAYMWFGEDAADTVDHSYIVAVFHPS